MARNLCIDLFAGEGGWSQAFEEADDWEVIRVDNNDASEDDDFDVDIVADVRTIRPDDFDTDGCDTVVVLASPPCTVFTIAAIGYHQTKVGKDKFKPKSDKARRHIALAHYTFYLIRSIDPDWWFLENPARGIMQKYVEPPESEVTWCQYGYDYQKPTHLWGDHPPSFPYLKCKAGEECHIPNPRGGDNWGDGRETSAKRAKIPHGLSDAARWSVENPDADPWENPYGPDEAAPTVDRFL